MDGGWDRAAVERTLRAARHVVLVAHKNADGDAVGSLLGMAHLLRTATGAEVTPLLPDGCPDDLIWLPGTDRILDGQTQGDACRTAIAAADLVIGLDISGLDRTGCLAEPLGLSQAPRMLVDHHIGPDRDAFALVVSESEVSSTCELVYWLMQSVFGDSIFSRDAATCLYTGICTDTDTFSYSNDRPGVYLAAAALLAFGIDPMDINRQIKNVFTEQRLRFFGHALADLTTVYPQQEVALMVITAQDMRDFGVESAELTGLINEVMKLKAVDCGILVREEEGRTRVSMRSKVHYDVAALTAELFDGGGHRRAAGATSTLPLAPTVEAIKQQLALA